MKITRGLPADKGRISRGKGTMKKQQCSRGETVETAGNGQVSFAEILLKLY